MPGGPLMGECLRACRIPSSLPRGSARHPVPWDRLASRLDHLPPRIRIDSALLEQGGVATLFSDGAVFDSQDPVHRADGGEPMSDDQSCSPSRHVADWFADQTRRDRRNLRNLVGLSAPSPLSAPHVDLSLGPGRRTTLTRRINGSFPVAMARPRPAAWGSGSAASARSRPARNR